MRPPRDLPVTVPSSLPPFSSIYGTVADEILAEADVLFTPVASQIGQASAAAPIRISSTARATAVDAAIASFYLLDTGDSTSLAAGNAYKAAAAAPAQNSGGNGQNGGSGSGSQDGGNGQPDDGPEMHAETRSGSELRMARRGARRKTLTYRSPNASKRQTKIGQIGGGRQNSAVDRFAIDFYRGQYFEPGIGTSSNAEQVFIGGLVVANVIMGVPVGPPVGVPGVDSTFPPNDGFLGEPTSTTLQPGTVIDRYGGATGRYASPVGTPFEARSLPPEAIQRPLSKYEVIKPIDGVKTGPCAPYYGQPGLGTQYQLPRPIQWYVDSGYLWPVP